MPLKILTLNLRHNADRWTERLPLVIETLRRESPDVIAFQEVYLPIRQAELIASELDSAYTIYTGQKWDDDVDEGISLLTRLPVIQYEHRNLPEGGRLAQQIQIEFDGQPLHIVNTHLHHRPLEDENIRQPQMQTILAWLTERNALQNCILLGDMNSLSTSSTIQLALQSLQSALMPDQATFPSPLGAAHYPAGLAVQIDYIFYAAPRLQLLDAAVIANQSHPDDATLYPSDHYGIVVQFESGKLP